MSIIDDARGRDVRATTRTANETGAPAFAEPRPVLRATAARQVFERLREDILTLAVPPGAPLSDKELTERFGVSRTPLREALIRLAEERLVDIFPQSGTFVARIPLGALPEAVIVRKALERACLDLAMDRADGPSLSVLDGIIARQAVMAGLGDRPGFHAADEAFHEAIAVLAGHPGVWRIAQQAKTQIDRCRMLTLPAPGRMDQVIAEHRAVVAAMRAGDRATAHDALDRHLSAVLPDVEHLRRVHVDYFA